MKHVENKSNFLAERTHIKKILNLLKEMTAFLCIITVNKTTQTFWLKIRTVKKLLNHFYEMTAFYALLQYTKQNIS